MHGNDRRTGVEDAVAEQQEQAADDAMMTRIGQVIMLHRGGDRAEARDRFLGLWSEIGEDGDPLHRCTLAHYMADTQDDPADELAWDLRALSAAEELTDGRLAQHEQSLAVRALYPSLHLNLAADYFKLGRSEAARTHLSRARGAVGALADDSYGAGIRAAIGRLEVKLDAGEAGGGGPEGGAGPSREGPLGPPRQESP
ncbi:tetratricopeptide repeat protein [Streptomyces himalayensis]|uniref:Tetratricopeptide repeat protein n=1 Tax=Streptomyces himalayensis subsp. himalayensis TaxID=2756131 RepID=A0A7W0I8Y7_9ACTN|nr:tetratricopeptide repeat protein [Streptomyces himalayensis]MBA2946805.1 tetratricopeptide repeat protein [Streptomyces himalayensis subsp. himalayensis]